MDHPLEQWRIAADIDTKTEAASVLGMKPSQYGDILAGRTEPSLERLRSIRARAQQFAPLASLDVDAIIMWKARRGAA